MVSRKFTGSMTRRAFTGGALALGAAGLLAARTGRAEIMEIDENDMVLGDPDAPVTVVEYASMTCPHCASFHREIYPSLKKDYIDTGKAKFVFREFPLDRAGFQAAILARCGGKERFFGFIDVLFKSQDSWSRSAVPLTALRQIGTLGGVSEAEFDACLTDEALQKLILDKRAEGNQRYGVNSTPSLVVDGVKLSGGEASLEALGALIESKQP